jgi:hypothetical protein
MRGKKVRHLYLSEQEEHVLTIFFNTVTSMADKDRKLDMTELLKTISLGCEKYDAYGQEFQIHYND